MKKNHLAAFALAWPLSGMAAEGTGDILGQWAGIASYLASTDSGGASLLDKNIELTVVVDKGGRVLGVSSANGCTFTGEYKRSLSANEFPVKAVLSGCNYQAFNTKYTGNLTFFPSNNTMRLILSRTDTPAPRKTVRYHIEGRMQRDPS